MKQGLSEIVCVVDRSGSMGSIRNDAIHGFNSFLEDQKQQPGEARLTVVFFNDKYDVIHDGKPLAQVPALTRETYEPYGSTALLDAVGRAITTVGARLADTPEADRPEQVIVVILTDGEENSSKEYTRARIADMIQHQQEVYSWRFIYLGANVDAFAEAQQLNILAAMTSSFAATGQGVQAAYTVMSRATSMLRTGQSLENGAWRTGSGLSDNDANSLTANSLNVGQDSTAKPSRYARGSRA